MHNKEMFTNRLYVSISNTGTKEIDNIFILTEKILKNHEMKILNYTDKQIFPEIPLLNNFLKKIFYIINKYITYPFKYLFLGAKDFFKPLFIWTIISYTFLVIFSIFIPESNNIPQNINFIIINGLNISLIISMLLVIFSVPTTFAFYGLNNKEIMDRTKDLMYMNITTKVTIEYIEKNLEKIYIRVTKRYNTYRWVIGSIWVTSLLIFSILIRLYPNIEWIEILNQNKTPFLMYIFFILVLILMNISYKRASDILFISLEFSLIELKYKLDLREQKKGNKYIHRIRKRYKSTTPTQWCGV